MSTLKRLARKLEKLPADLGRLKESIAYTVNPNHRHDEEHEKEEDARRTAICKSHRFESFARERPGNEVKWYIDGHDYFYALSMILDEAKESIMILDWWLTPELFLRRPCAHNDEFRLDRLLLRKAEQGVKIYVMVYKEVTQTMSMSSHHTKHHLEDMHENIAVMRHPDHLGGEMTLYWSHHEKVVIVDNIYACIGGLDICFGRWDTHTFPLADFHPTDHARTLFAGQDFNNARIADFTAVDHWASNQQTILETPRMPWHDVHSMLVGPAVMDIAQHFVERWNFVRALKYRGDARYDHLAFPHYVQEEGEPVAQEDEAHEPIVRHPHWESWKQGTLHGYHKLFPAEGGHKPYGGHGKKGQMAVQVLRSSADWSHGILTEHSIMNAYVQMIREANHYIYIENQFFVTNTVEGKGPVQNLIGAAIVERVISAARNNTRFKVVIVIPAIPGFSGDLDGNSGTLAIMLATYKSISRGEYSIFGQIRKEGIDPEAYISVYNLRSYDRINYDPARIKAMEEASGVTVYQAQAALCRVYLGSDVLEEEMEKNRIVTFRLAEEGGEASHVQSEKKANEEAQTVTINLPETIDEAWSILNKFEKASDLNERVSDSVAHHAFKGQGSLFDEVWTGNEESERLAWVDDRRVLIGSANLNDRSQLGDHDSEIAIVIEDPNTIESTMDGQSYRASKFAATFRRQLYKEHLGLSEPQFCPAHGAEPVTPAMTPVGHPEPEYHASPEDLLVADPVSEETDRLLKSIASKNTEVFSNVYHCVPDAKVETWEEYKAWVPQKPMKPGHVANPTMDVRYIKEQLDQVRGHLVECPLNFLQRADMRSVDASVNPITLAIYL